MKIDYLTKVGAAFTAFFTPSSDGLIGGKPAPTELVSTKSVAIIGKVTASTISLLLERNERYCRMQGSAFANYVPSLGNGCFAV